MLTARYIAYASCLGLVLIGVVIVLVALAYLNSESVCPFIMGNWYCFDPVGIRTVELLIGGTFIFVPSLICAKLWVDGPSHEERRS